MVHPGKGGVAGPGDFPVGAGQTDHGCPLLENGSFWGHSILRELEDCHSCGDLHDDRCANNFFQFFPEYPQFATQMIYAVLVIIIMT